MELKDIEQLFLHRQSCRQFSDKSVSEDLVREVCRVALLAPSATNAQPWKLIAVTGEKKDELAKTLMHLGMNKFVAGAPVLIAVVEGKGNLLTKASAVMKKENEFLRNDLGILTAHLTLAAEAAGLGTCIIGWRNEEKIRELLGLGKNALVPEVVALGYPIEGYEIRPKKRKNLEDTFTYLA